MPSTDPYVIPDLHKVAFDTRYQTRAGVGGSGNSNSGSGRNLAINGGFDFAQRQAPATLTAYSTTGITRQSAADMWSIAISVAGSQYQRVDTLTPETNLRARYYGKFKKITGSGKIIICQVVEADNLIAVRGKSVRLSAKMKFTVAASMTVRLGLLQLTSAGTVNTVPSTIASAIGANSVDPTWGTNISAITPDSADPGTIVGTAATCVLTGAWVKYSANFTVPSNCKNLVIVIFSDSALAVSDELNISEVDLQDGTFDRDYPARAYGDELRLVQRYYQKSFSIDQAPVQNLGLNTGEARWLAGIAGANIERSPQFLLPTPMLKLPPTRTTYNPAAASAEARDTTAAANCTAIGLTMNFESSFYIIATGAAGTAVGNHIAVHWTLDAPL